MLKARKKITKREMKEDPLVTAYIRVQKFIQRHSKTINIGLIAIVLLTVFITFDSKNKKDSNKNAESDIVMAEQIYFSKDYDRAINALLPVAEQYRGTVAAGRAVFYIANAYFEQGVYTEARQYFQQYVDDYGQIDYFKSSSYAGIAACYENEMLYAEAAQAYEKAAKTVNDDFSTPFRLKDAARCYILADQFEKGRALYQHLLDKYPDAAIADEVAFLVESM
ncbi:tol-pal system YbgF family protein [bacterium]